MVATWSSRTGGLYNLVCRRTIIVFHAYQLSDNKHFFQVIANIKSHTELNRIHGYC